MKLNQNEPEVSIITPVFNGQKYIDQVLNSILNQTFSNFEWIIIDDCSTDMTGVLLEKVAEQEPRIHLLYLDTNVGPIKARNWGLETARGRFVAFIDIDDLWLPEKLEKQLDFMKSNNLPLSYTGYRKITDDGKMISRFTIPVPKRLTYKKLLISNSIMASSAMFDRSITGNIKQDENAPISKDDLMFWLSILNNCGSIKGLQEDLCRLRIHKRSITNNKLLMAKRHWHFYRETLGLSHLTSLKLYIGYSIKGIIKYLL